MCFDSRIFNVNGSGLDMLTKTLELVFIQEGAKTAKSFIVDKEKGLIIYWGSVEGCNTFMAPLSAKKVATQVYEWLQTDEAKTIEYDSWCIDADHDGHNSEGWQVYCEEWGHVKDSNIAICAVKHAYIWYGK